MSLIRSSFRNVNARILSALFGGWRLWAWVGTITVLEIIGLQMYLHHLTDLGTNPALVFVYLLGGLVLIIDVQLLYICSVGEEFYKLKEASADLAPGYGRDNPFGG